LAFTHSASVSDVTPRGNFDQGNCTRRATARWRKLDHFLNRQVATQVVPYLRPTWVKIAILTVRGSLLVYPDKQTSSGSGGISQRCQQETHPLQQI